MASIKSPHKINHSKTNCRRQSEMFIYERLLLLNLHARAIGEVIKDLAIERALLKSEATYFGLMVEEARASLSQSVVETMDAREIHTSAVVSRGRLRMEKKLLGEPDA